MYVYTIPKYLQGFFEKHMTEKFFTFSKLQSYL